MIFMASPFKRYYITVIILIATSNFEKALSLESNEEQSPQRISDYFESLCLSRSSDCEVELDVPSSCVTEEGTSRCPIIFFLHGAGGTNNMFGRTSGVHDRNMIGVYPNGDCRGWNTGPKDCNQCSYDNFDCTSDPNEGEFIASIISTIRDLGALGNVYVRGNSNGAALALRLAVNAGNKLPIKGIVASVTQLLESPQRSGPGVLNYNQPLSSNPPVSVLSISGTADGLIPYEGGTSAVFGGNDNFYLMSCEESNEKWALHNNCDNTPVVSTVSASLGDGTADYYQYLNCDDGVFVEHYKVYGAGHNAGRTELDGKSSNEVAYDFITKIEEADKNTPIPIPTMEPTPLPSMEPSISNPPSASKPPHPEPSTNPPFLTFPPNDKPECLTNDETCVPLWQKPPNDSLKCCPGLICKKSPIDQMPAKFECVKGPDKPTQNPIEKPTCAVEKKSCGSKVKGGTVCCDGLQCCKGKNCGTPFRGKCVKKQENTCAATSEPCGRKFKGEADCCDELECCKGKKCGQSVFKGVCKEKPTCAAKKKPCGKKFKGQVECCEGLQCCKGKNNCENVWRGKCIRKAQ